MTLSEIADFVCEKVGVRDDDSVTLAKSFATKRHKMIWDQFLWRDSVSFGTVSVSANQTYVLAPRDISQVLIIRENTGNSILSLDQQEIDFLINPSARDTAAPVRKFMPAGTAVAVPPASGELVVINGGTEASGAEVTICYELSTEDQSGRIVTTTYDLTDGSPTTVLNVVSVLSVYKTETANQFEISIGGIPYYTMLPEETEAARRARVRLASPCQTAVNLLFIGKRHPNRFSDDSDLPSIFGIDNALLCFVEGDMLARQRQRGKANLCYAEGAAHVKGMIDQERNQSASLMRIVPFVEGPPNDGLPSSKAFF